MQVLLAALLPLMGHVLAFAAALFAAQMVRPSAGGFADLGAAVGAFVVVEVLLAVTCIGLAVYYLMRNQRPMGVTVAASWLLGAFVSAIVLGTLTS